MTIYNQVHTLSNTTATLIVPAHQNEQEVHLHNNERNPNIHIHFGNADMTLNNSIRIDRGETVTYNIQPGDELYAMTDNDGSECGVLRITQD